MIVLLLASSLQAAAATAVAPAPLPRFSDLPNVTVTYYDVTGRTVREVMKSIEQKAQRDPKTNRPIPATSDWSVGAAVNNSTTGNQCKVTSAKLNFRATARMPRLVALGSEPITPKLQANWQRYVAQLEARQVTQLRFAYDRLPAIEQQILASSCQNWKTVASAALEKLKKDKAEARARDTTPAPVLTDG